MPASQIALDVSAFSIGGTDQKAYLKSGSLKFINGTADGRSVVQRHANPVKSSRAVQVQASLMDNVGSTVNRVTFKDISAFTLGGNSFAGYLKSFNFNRTCSHKSAQGDGSESSFPVYTGEDTSISVELNVPVAAVPAFMAGLDADAQAASDLAFSITINGAAVTIAAMVLDATMGGLEADGLQSISLNLGGRLTATAPTGTATLFAAAITAPETAVAISATTKASGGLTWAGNGLVSSISVSGSEGGLVLTDVTYDSVGAWTLTATA